MLTTPDERVHSDYRDLAEHFRHELHNQRKSPKTIKTYCESVRLLGAYLADHGLPTEPERITREDVQSFMNDQEARWKPATALNRYRGLTVFFGWCVGEEVLDASPMAKMTPPRVIELPPPVISEDQQRQLIKTCSGRTFEDRRDLAVILLLIDSGMRRSECSGLKIADIDFTNDVALVMGKGSRPRQCAFGHRTASALLRYIRERNKRKDARRYDDLWLGHAGPMTDSGIARIVQRRAEAAGLGHIRPHQFRHSYADSMLRRGMLETDLMRNAGWRSRSMLERYGAARADERARDAAHRLSPADQL